MEIYSKLIRARCWSACCSWPCSETGVGQGHVQRSLPISAIPWDPPEQFHREAHVTSNTGPLQEGDQLPPLQRYGQASVEGQSKHQQWGKKGAQAHIPQVLQVQQFQLKNMTCGEILRKHLKTALLFSRERLLLFTEPVCKYVMLGRKQWVPSFYFKSLPQKKNTTCVGVLHIHTFFKL